MNQQQQQQILQQTYNTMNNTSSPGLTRYRSAPSSYFTNLLSSTNTDHDDGLLFGTSTAAAAADDILDDILFDTPPASSSIESQQIFSRFINNTTSTGGDAAIQQYSCSSQLNNNQFLAPVKTEPQPQPQQLHRQRSNVYSNYNHSQQAMFQDIISSNTSDKATTTTTTSSSVIDGSIINNNSNNNNNIIPVKIEQQQGHGFGGNSSSLLVRHQSSPAGLFDNILFQTEFGAIMRDLGSSGHAASNNASPKPSFNSSASRFSKSKRPPPVPETRSKKSEEKTSIDLQLDEDVPLNAWDDSSILSDMNFLKEFTKNVDDKPFSNENTSNDHDQNSNEGGKPSTTRLAHHLSLPTSASELSAMEKFLNDSVPCKIRAKRGFATHPRSIAERVRRTKISDRIRKLQDLVPNMDKQTNTSDMLDFAVDYIKELQGQLKTLSEKRAKCSCSIRRKLS